MTGRHEQARRRGDPPPHTGGPSRAAVPSSRSDLPEIDGYTVWNGRQLWHARYKGTCAEANRAGLRWHVVAASPELLAEEAKRGPWSPPNLRPA